MRIRSVKPEWLEDVKMTACSDSARMLSIALIVMADDEGRGRLGMPASVRVWPYTPHKFQKTLEELIGWYVKLYRVRGEEYYELCNWHKHQRINRPSSSKIPAPSEGQPINSMSPHGGFSEDSVNAHGGLTEGSLRERDRKRIGIKELNAGSADAAPALPVDSLAVSQELELPNSPQLTARKQSKTKRNPLKSPNSNQVSLVKRAGARGGRKAKSKDLPVVEVLEAKPLTVWEAYSDAYERRYGVPPTRNARVNGQLSQFVARVGKAEAPEVARFYIRHNSPWYVKKGHAVGAMLADAEKLRTEWATNRPITSGDAREAERADEFIAQGERVDDILEVWSDARKEQTNSTT